MMTSLVGGASLTLQVKSEVTPTILLPVATSFRSLVVAIALIGDEEIDRNLSGWLISNKNKIF